MYTSGYKKRTFSRRAATEDALERSLSETPEEAWERFCAVTGFEPVVEEDGAWEDDDDYDKDIKSLPPERPKYELPYRPVKYYKLPLSEESLSTRKGPGQRARLVYAPKKKVRHSIHGLKGPEGYKFSPRLHKIRASLATPRSARFSSTVDMEWKGGGVLGHRQLSVFLDDLCGYDNLLGFAPLQRREQYSKYSTGARRRKPLFYEQKAVPFYYAMQTHSDVFHRSWSHAVRAANVVKAKRQSLVWPNVPWGDHVSKGTAARNKVELCRTPIDAVKVHYPDGSAKPALTYSEEHPTAYEVVELVCGPASPENITLINEQDKKATTVENKSRYKNVHRYSIRFKRVAYDDEGNELPVSFLGFTKSLRIPIDTVVKLIDVIPDLLYTVRSYFAQYPEQADRMPYYKQHPNPLLRRWGFFVSDELKYGEDKLSFTFTNEREEAYLTDKTLYDEGDCPRYCEKGSQGTSLTDLHPRYIARLAALAAGELLWRSDEWAVREEQAREDVEALERRTNVGLAASMFVYSFCAALVRVFLDTTKRHRYCTYATRVRKSLDGKKLIKLRFCRGPPSFL